MSFRFVTTAVGILGAAFASTGAVMNAAPPRPAAAPPPAVSMPAAPAPMALAPPPLAPAPPELPPPRPGRFAATPPAPAPTQPVMGSAWRPPLYVVATNDLGMPKVWIGPGGHFSPLDRELTRDEEESGWADGPEFLGRELIAGLGVVPVRSPNPDVLVVPGVGIGPNVGGSHVVIPAVPRALIGPETRLAPSVVLEPQAPGGPRSELPGWAVHIASYHSQPAAAQGWAVLSAHHPALLTPLQPTFATVTIPGRGPVVRVLAGHFGSRDAAQGACAPLQQAGLYCQAMSTGHHARL